MRIGLGVGTWRMVYDVRGMRYGLWDMENGIWDIGYKIMGLGLEYGICDLACEILGNGHGVRI